MTYHPAHLIPATEGRTYADFLAEARVRQAGAGFSGPLLSVTDEELARADADISWRLERARKPRAAANGYRLTAYGLEKVS